MNKGLLFISLATSLLLLQHSNAHAMNKNNNSVGWAIQDPATANNWDAKKETIEQVLQAGGNPNQPALNCNPLFKAYEQQDIVFFKKLITEYRANPFHPICSITNPGSIFSVYCALKKELNNNPNAHSAQQKMLTFIDDAKQAFLPTIMQKYPEEISTLRNVFSWETEKTIRLSALNRKRANPQMYLREDILYNQLIDVDYIKELVARGANPYDSIEFRDSEKGTTFLSTPYNYIDRNIEEPHRTTLLQFFETWSATREEK